MSTAPRPAMTRHLTADSPDQIEPLARRGIGIRLRGPVAPPPPLPVRLAPPSPAGPAPLPAGVDRAAAA